MAELPSDQINRLEQYLNYLATGSGEIPSEPQNRLEQYLEYLCENGSGGGLPDPTLLPAGSVLVGDGAEWKPQDGYGYTGKQLKAETNGYGPEITYLPTPPHPELTYKALLMPTTSMSIDFTPASVVYNWDGSEHPFTYDDTLGYYVFDEGFIYSGMSQSTFTVPTNVYVQENVLPEDESARTVKVYENVLHQMDIKYIPGGKQMFSMQIVWMISDYYFAFPDAPNFIRAVNAAGTGWTQKIGIYNAISLDDGNYDATSMSYTINVALLLQLQSGEPVVYLFNMTRDPDAPNFHQIGTFKMSNVLPTVPSAVGTDGTGVVYAAGKWVTQAGYAVNTELTMDNSVSKLDPEGEYTPFQMSNWSWPSTPSSIKYSWDNSVHPVTVNPSTGVWEFDDGFIDDPPPPSFNPYRVMVRTSVFPSYLANLSVTVQQRIVQKFDPDLLPDLPYKSIRRLASYTYEVTFDTIPEDTNANLFTASGCSSIVSNGRLYSNLDWKYNDDVVFHVKCNGFEGMAFSDRLPEGALDDDLIGQLPYHIRDGRNDSGIMVATHVLYRDWSWNEPSSSNLVTKIPYRILTELHSMSDFETWFASASVGIKLGYLAYTHYTLQFIVTDGTTTYVITPDENPLRYTFVAINATSNPKLTNFRWVDQSTISSRSSLPHAHATGMERWNALAGGAVPNMADVRFTQSYVRTDRLSDFIGESGTTKDSTDAELMTVRDLAYALYQTRARDGDTWQTVYSVVYSPKKLEALYIQEDFETNIIGENVSSGEPTELNADYVFAMPRKIYLGSSEQDAVKLYFDSMIPQRYTPRVGNYTAICEMRLTEDYLKLVPGTTGTKGIDSYVYDEQMNLIDSHSNTEHYYDVVVGSAVPSSQTMLLLGDSFIEQGYIAPDLRGLFTADTNTLTLIGTKGSGDNKHEGYAGKSAVDFASGFSGSPFGESGFDFASYMTSHGYTVDSVYIQLGTNDVSAGSIMSNAQISAVVSALNTIVGAIHAHSSTIKIVLGTTVGCTADTAKFSEAYYGNGEREIMQQNMRKLAAAIIDHFADVANVRVAPVVGILDPTEDFHNSVHPNAGGYAKMAKCVYDTMRGF